MPIIVPLWFYEFGSVMYFFAALIGFLLTYFSFKLYNYTRKKSHLLLNLSFAFITIGFIVLTVSNTYSHFNFEQCHPDCIISQQEIFNRIVVGNYVYYITSIIGYSLFLFSYNFNFKDRKSRRKLFFQLAPPVALNVLFQNQAVFVLFPFESQFFQPFHMISSILLLFIVFRTFSNYKKKQIKHFISGASGLRSNTLLPYPDVQHSFLAAVLHIRALVAPRRFQHAAADADKGD